MKVTLALDLGTHTGYAVLRADGRIESGSERFAPRAKEGEGARFIRFRSWLLEMKQANGQIARVAYERVHHVGANQAYAAQLYGGFLAIVLMFCEHHQLEHEGFQIQSIKKRWTGNGAAKKPEMMARCQSLGFAPANDNEADAIALLHVACDRVPKLPIEMQVKKRPLRKNSDTATAGIPFDPF